MRKLIIYAIAACAFLLFNASGCNTKESDTCHRFIHFTNNSGKDVYFSFSVAGGIPSSNPTTAPEYYKIKESNTRKLSITTGHMCFEDLKKESINGLYLYLFDPNIIRNFSWETVRKENMYLKKYVLTIDELNKANWKIVFTGD